MMVMIELSFTIRCLTIYLKNMQKTHWLMLKLMEAYLKEKDPKRGSQKTLMIIMEDSPEFVLIKPILLTFYQMMLLQLLQGFQVLTKVKDLHSLNLRLLLKKKRIKKNQSTRNKINRKSKKELSLLVL